VAENEEYFRNEHVGWKSEGRVEHDTSYGLAAGILSPQPGQCYGL